MESLLEIADAEIERLSMGSVERSSFVDQREAGGSYS